MKYGKCVSTKTLIINNMHIFFEKNPNITLLHNSKIVQAVVLVLSLKRLATN